METNEGGLNKMILFTILAIILAIITVIAILTIAIGGAGFIVIFGDLIVCAVIIGLIMKALFRKRHK